jgi:multiple antibiotic resistance protein
MDSIITNVVTVFTAFFAIMNPMASVPVFLSLTRGDDAQTTRKVAFRSLVVAFSIVVLFSVAGKVILEVFGLTLPAFRVTGGIIVFFIGLHMLQGNQSNVQQPSDKETQNARDAELSIAITPLGMPILAGPGTIATAMNFSASGGITAMIITISSFAVLCVITYFFFTFGVKLLGYLGANVLGVITRMMGLILAAVGTQMLIEGVRGAFSLGG